MIGTIVKQITEARVHGYTVDEVLVPERLKRPLEKEAAGMLFEPLRGRIEPTSLMGAKLSFSGDGDFVQIYCERHGKAETLLIPLG